LEIQKGSEDSIWRTPVEKVKMQQILPDITTPICYISSLSEAKDFCLSPWATLTLVIQTAFSPVRNLLFVANTRKADSSLRLTE